MSRQHPVIIDEAVVNRWIQRYLSINYKSLKDDEITVTEAVSPCLRRSYYARTRVTQPTPVEFLKVAGQDIHLALQDILRGEGWDVEVSVALPVNDFVLRGRIDAVKEDTIIEFKTSSNMPEDSPYESHELQAQAYITMMHASQAYIIYLSRANGKTKVYRIHPNKQALKQVVERAKQLHQALKNGQPPQRTRGPWCSYCSYRPNCTTLLAPPKR
ncbi:MAG: CRISPR-associated protein Cas4 [Thermosphaera sp.]